ncbi:MAG: ABC transporter permease subunit, partial [Gammaproteobacteria bacterium]|nr:ABC transporter permease subunit [Gammaproteobacteria bacterium]
AGTSLLAGIIVLAIMILPLVSLVAIATFERLDNQQLQSAWLLGMKKSAIVWYIVLPLSRQSLISGSLLQTARALGETMAVLMVCGNVVAIPNSFLAPVRTLTANIALETAYAMDAHRSALFAGGLLLALFVFILLMLIYRMHGSVSHAHE